MTKILATAELTVGELDIVQELIGIVEEIVRIDKMVDRNTKNIDPKWFDLRDEVRAKFNNFEDKIFGDEG